jgi:membrane protein
VLAGPSLVERLLPTSLDFLSASYWPIVTVGTVCFLASLFHFAVPVRTRWRAELPGAAVTLGIWVLGSALLRWFLGAFSGSTSIYGPLAAPIAVLIWLYLTSMAVLLGAAVNAAIDEVWPRLSGADQSRPAQLDAEQVTDPAATTDDALPPSARVSAPETLTPVSPRPGTPVSHDG